MFIVLITGKMGVGKSQVLTYLKSRSYSVFQADQVVKSLLEPKSPYFSSIRQIFDKEVLTPQGQWNKKLMAQEIFNDSEKRQKMERIIHPLVRKEFDKFIEEEKKKQIKVVFYEVPLLSKNVIQDRFDYIVLVKAPDNLIIERLKKQGMTESNIRLRWQAQISQNELDDLVDFILVNDGNRDHLKKQVDLILNKIEDKLQ